MFQTGWLFYELNQWLVVLYKKKTEDTMLVVPVPGDTLDDDQSVLICLIIADKVFEESLLHSAGGLNHYMESFDAGRGSAFVTN